MTKPALGRGLGALLSGAPPVVKPATTVTAPGTETSAIPAPVVLHAAAHAVSPGEHVQRVALSRIQPCPFQPRKDFTPETLKELSDSIREQGIVQPLIVRDKGDHFELIAGERRWRAAQLLNLPEVPVIVREADDRAVLELALIENLQRENLNPIEEAAGYSQLISQFALKQEEVAQKVGKSRTVVANALRLLKLPVPVQNLIREGKLSVGHAKVILGLASEKSQQSASERVLKEGLNVRQTEDLVAKWNSRAAGVTTAPVKLTPLTTDTHVSSLENKLREKFGTKVHVRYSSGKGSVEISFYSDVELERVLELLGVRAD